MRFPLAFLEAKGATAQIASAVCFRLWDEASFWRSWYPLFLFWFGRDTNNTILERWYVFFFFFEGTPVLKENHGNTTILFSQTHPCFGGASCSPRLLSPTTRFYPAHTVGSCFRPIFPAYGQAIQSAEGRRLGHKPSKGLRPFRSGPRFLCPSCRVSCAKTCFWIRASSFMISTGRCAGTCQVSRWRGGGNLSSGKLWCSIGGFQMAV